MLQGEEVMLDLFCHVLVDMIEHLGSVPVRKLPNQRTTACHVFYKPTHTLLSAFDTGWGVKERDSFSLV